MLRRRLPLWALLLSACLSGGSSGGYEVVELGDPLPAEGPRILCIVAHPDDEVAFAGLVYKTSTFLDGVVDLAVITNGEGGFKYSTLAEPIYGLELTEESIGRAALPDIRRDELLEACGYMRFRRVCFFGQQDHRFTTDVEEVLAADATVWDLAAVERGLVDLMERSGYGFVLTLAPSPGTHAHHKAATVLALRAAASLPQSARPAVLCVQGQGAGAAQPPAPAPLEGYPETACEPATPAFAFDRTESFGHRDKLDYRIIANWAIAAHKSQGTMQLYMNGSEREVYHLFSGGPSDAGERCRTLFESLREPQFRAKTYGASAGTNAR